MARRKVRRKSSAKKTYQRSLGRYRSAASRGRWSASGRASRSSNSRGGRPQTLRIVIEQPKADVDPVQQLLDRKPRTARF